MVKYISSSSDVVERLGNKEGTDYFARIPVKGKLG